MKRRLSIVISLIVLASMLFAACAPATATQAPAPAATEAATATTAPQATEAPTATTAPAEPTATAAATEAPTATEAPKSTRTGAWLDSIVFSAIAGAESGVQQIQAGAVDMYAVSASNAKVFETVKSDPNLNYVNVYGSTNQLLFNTVECTDKTILNPFTDMKIREAMNWAVDRNYISQEIAGGLGTPKFTALSTAFPDAARYAGTMAAIQTKYAYNMDKAKAVVDEEMPKLGAKLEGGKWTFNGKPVTIIGLIRTEDSRKEIGNYFANQLEALGFTVDRQEKVRKEAGPIWQGDPYECKFGYYTGGWISTAISRDEGNMFAQYNTGKIQGIPLFNEFKPSAELASVEDKLMTNDFKTMDERAELFKKAIELSMTESWWGVWTNDNVAFEPYKNTISGASDLAGGFASAQLFPYTVRINGQEGGTVKIAQSGIMVQPWNPLNGSNWTDDAMVQRTTEDWGVIADPYTGLQLPKLVAKGEVLAKTGLPITKTLDWVTLSFADEIPVPDDAWADWNAETQTFITAKERAAADTNYKQTANMQSTITYIPDLFKTKWHDGSNLSVGDFVMAMIMTFDQGKEKSKIYDETVKATVDTYLTHFKGVKITSTDPLTIVTWDDTYGLDAENSVTTWYPTYAYGPGAWHNLAPAIFAEADGKLAFSTDKAGTLKVEWTSLLAGPSLDIQAEYLKTAAAAGTLPYEPTMSQFVKADEVKTRYSNLQAWYTAKKHLWIGTGPFFIDQVFPVEGTITVSRFADYMFPSDQFSGFGEPMLATVTVDGPTQVTAGEEAVFDVTVNFKDAPYPADKIDSVSYSVFDANGEIVAEGSATAVADGQYQITLAKDVTAKLSAGASKLSVAVASKAVSLPTFATYEFVAAK